MIDFTEILMVYEVRRDHRDLNIKVALEFMIWYVGPAPREIKSAEATEGTPMFTSIRDADCKMLEKGGGQASSWALKPELACAPAGDFRNFKSRLAGWKMYRSVCQEEDGFSRCTDRMVGRCRWSEPRHQRVACGQQLWWIQWSGHDYEAIYIHITSASLVVTFVSSKFQFQLREKWMNVNMGWR